MEHSLGLLTMAQTPGGEDYTSLLSRLLTEYRPYLYYALGALLGLLILGGIWRRIRRAIRRNRPAQIHPSLQKYNVDHVELDRQRRETAVGVVATSTGNRLAGFRIVRQVEAVFVEGFRTPDEALTALKALAVERGANALLNVQTERTTAGRCSASGDAIVAAPIPPGPPDPMRPLGPRPSRPPQPPPPDPKKT
ncbi:MAG: hypothetical protein QUV05_20845 [Phycisphaerae bacterium]|nr:hypothetical protein [Phycisphaerae bacterium]